jgi:hypothetical protein
MSHTIFSLDFYDHISNIITYQLHYESSLVGTHTTKLYF